MRKENRRAAGAGNRRMSVKRAGSRFLSAVLILSVTFSLCGCSFARQAADTFYSGLGRLVVGEPRQAASVSGDRYAYQQLGPEEQTVYDQIVETVANQAERASVSTESEKVLERAYTAVMADYGEFFWVSGYRYNTYTSGDQVIGMEILPVYTMDQTQREAEQRQVQEEASRWLGEVSPQAGDYEKAKFVYETLIQRVDYALDAVESQNILSVFLYGETVCQGYAEAAAYLLQRLGIQCAVVTGTAQGEPHAWNLVRLDGEYYYMDVTWGNSTYLTEDEQEKKTVDYAYLNLTTEELMETHVADGQISLPQCTATEDNYFRREGLYFSRWDPEAIGNVFGEAWRQDTSASVRLSDPGLYQQTLEYFIFDRGIVDFCPEIEDVYYRENSQLQVLTLQF